MFAYFSYIKLICEVFDSSISIHIICTEDREAVNEQYYMFNIISVKNSKNRKKKVLGEENTIKTLVILGPVFPNLIECSKGPGAPGLLGIQVHLAFYLQLLSEKVHMVVTVNTHLKMQTTK